MLLLLLFFAVAVVAVVAAAVAVVVVVFVDAAVAVISSHQTKTFKIKQSDYQTPREHCQSKQGAVIHGCRAVFKCRFSLSLSLYLSIYLSLLPSDTVSLAVV